MVTADQTSPPLERGILQGIAVFRWLTWGWAAIGVVISRDELAHPVPAALLLAGAFLFSAAATVLVTTQPRVLLSPILIGIELVMAASMLVADGWVFDPGRPQSLPWSWPAAGIITAAVAYGNFAGVIAALGMAVASFVGESQLGDNAEWSIAASSKTALYILAALVAGTVSSRLRRAEQEISTVRAREEMARTLHDGVLQTLAVVQRRSSDPELADLAREQERDLRDYLFGVKQRATPLPVALRESASAVAKRFDIHPEVVVADDLPTLAADKASSLAAAVGEALTNAAKHADATRWTVYAEPDDDDIGVLCTVTDNGSGFDPTTAHVGEGLRRSIHERIEQAGGRVEVHSRAGRGTEVRLWLS